MEGWFRDAWRLNEEVLLVALKEDLFLLELDSPEKAKWVLESGKRSFLGGDLQLEWWSPESGCMRSKDLGQEAWIRVLGLPLHLWTPEILRKIGDTCGGFMEVDKNTEKKKEVKWARMMIKMVGKSRPRVVNILEGPRSFELQIWWEVSPWVTGVHPVSSRAVVKNPEVDEEGWSRVVKRVGASKQKSNDEGQKKQVQKTNWGKKQGTGDGDAVGLVSAAVLIGSGGAHEEMWDFKSDRNWSEGEGLIQHGGPGGGSCFHPGLKGADYPGPREIISKSPSFIKAGKGMKYGLQLQQAAAHMCSSVGTKAGNGMKYGLQLQQAAAHMCSSVGTARRFEKFGPKPGSMQAGPSNRLENLIQSKKDNWGLKKGFTKARCGSAGGTSGSSEEWRMKEGGTRPGAEGASNPLSDPAWICARGPLLHAKEGWSGRERTSSFESS